MNMPSTAELERIYGESEQSQKRFQTLAETFYQLYHHKNAEFFSAPGRTEIIGNHTDHNGGRVIAASIDMDTIGAAYQTTAILYILPAKAMTEKLLSISITWMKFKDFRNRFPCCRNDGGHSEARF